MTRAQMSIQLVTVAYRDASKIQKQYGYKLLYVSQEQENASRKQNFYLIILIK